MQIIHITDLHYTRGSPFQTELIKALLADLKRLVDEGASPDFLVFSGDLVNDPDESDIYAEFEASFLGPVLDVILVRPSEVIFCPGSGSNPLPAGQAHRGNSQSAAA